MAAPRLTQPVPEPVVPGPFRAPCPLSDLMEQYSRACWKAGQLAKWMELEGDETVRRNVRRQVIDQELDATSARDLLLDAGIDPDQPGARMLARRIDALRLASWRCESCSGKLPESLECPRCSLPF